ncbi:MAG: 2OG-Fe(II) oxygenase [Gammaproteobacteria bacterium]|nr:2OG-Fe(II) oxygenase [Gammaproteobacteria bacterium]MAY01571.1 2OG-Fe(II) oxygenase [Gammaproteobacteria bacterium]|tara:strand:+ start:155 stop:817 length:663 start_codon:yes stop_codon:yes gene_type:complete
MSARIKRADDSGADEWLFAGIGEEIYSKGYSIQHNAVPVDLCESLFMHLQQMDDEQFVNAGIGRQRDYSVNGFVRRDEICWINGNSDCGAAWLDWCQQLQAYLNRKLFLGLFSFESHFAHYAPGAFYKTHYDSFRGESNRRLSLVLYLNPGWLPDDGGELLIYLDEDRNSVRVTPGFGTLVTFLSEQFPHEVLPAKRDRYSIAGWYRVNSSTEDKVDPAS